MKNSAFACVLVALAWSSSAFAGKFEVWTYENEKAGTTEVVVSFTGDAVTQEAQLDLQFAEGLTVRTVDSLWQGSVCVANPDVHGLRAVPPSGAGNALPSKAQDVCKFTLNRAPSLAKSFKASSSFVAKLAECSAPGSDVGTCELLIQDVSE